MEIRRIKNTLTVIRFPIVDADGDFVTGATGLDSEVAGGTEGSAMSVFADCTNEATETGATGMYDLTLTAAEMNFDYVAVQVKTSSSGAKTQLILINLKPYLTLPTPINMVAQTAEVSRTVMIQASDANTGAHKTGLVYNTSGFTAAYTRSRAASVAVTLATQTVTGAFSSGGFVEVDATKAPGRYRFDTVNAGFLTGVNAVDYDFVLAGTRFTPVHFDILADNIFAADTSASQSSVDLLTAAGAEPTAVISPTATMMAKIDWLCAVARNKITQTATTQILKADDGTTTIATSTISDDGTTYTRGEFA